MCTPPSRAPQVESPALWIDLAIESAVRQEIKSTQDADADLNTPELVARFLVRDRRVWRTYCSPSHLPVLGHEPSSLLGEVTDLSGRLFRDVVLDHVVPQLASAFELGLMDSGFRFEMPFVHHDGAPEPAPARTRPAPAPKPPASARTAHHRVTPVVGACRARASSEQEVSSCRP